ncbi:MAG: glutathione S-transferase family protein [Actinomycetota bacterium]
MSVALYGHWICPFATRVQFALAQREIDHELDDLPPTGVRPPDFVLPPEFVEHSPKLEIPMVRVDDRYLADSIPILEWLDEEFAERSLLPASHDDRATTRMRMAWIDRHAFRPMIGVYYGTAPDRVERAATALTSALAEMGSWAAESGWLGGPDVSLADAVAMPINVRLAGLQQLGLTTDIPTKWAAYAERCRSVP